MEHTQTNPSRESTQQQQHNHLLRPEQRAPRGVAVKDLRPLRGRPFGPIPDLDALSDAAQQQAKDDGEKDPRTRTAG